MAELQVEGGELVLHLSGAARQLTINLNPGDNCFVVCAVLLARLLFERSSSGALSWRTV